jgi:hypothetical protein
MKKLYFLFFLTIGFLANSQIINFTDANFKAKLLEADIDNQIAQDLNYNYFKIDANNNGEIEFIEAEFVRGLNISNASISNLDGLNYFLNIESLDCNSNEIVDIDVSSLYKLNIIDFDNNPLLETANLKNKLIYFQYTLPPFPPSPDGGHFSNSCSSLKYICIEDEYKQSLLDYIDFYGITTEININDYCSFSPGGVINEVNGLCKSDYNSNGCDDDDINYPNLKIIIDDGVSQGVLIASSSGNYSIFVNDGLRTFTPVLENPTYFTVSPPSFSIDFPTQASPYTQNFCVTANYVLTDVEVVFLPTVPARPGFDASYRLLFRNKGHQIENGYITLTFDDTRLDYVSATPVYNSTATNSFTWDYTNLQPFETREFEITFNVNSPMETPAVNNGDVLNYTATITTTNIDVMPSDNTFTLDQTVVGSYDPNDKTCLQGETIEPSMVGEYVHYLIRFENTGTYFAENIVVKDIIDTSKFDIATLVPLKSSHDFFTRISGNKVEFIFENINLDFDDASNDGYVLFKIKTLPTLTIGDTFSNQVNIYFDYNFPIVTNNYTTTVQLLNNQSFEFSSYFTLYPNPIKDVLNIQSEQGIIVNSMEIYNKLGQIVMAVANTSNRVDISNLSSGIYFVKVNTDKGTANTKFIKE